MSVRLFSFRARAHRPRGAARFGQLENDYSGDDYHDDWRSTSREGAARQQQAGGVIAADRRTAAAMSEQQAIISELRDLGARWGANPGELMGEPSFQSLVSRLSEAQNELRSMLSGSVPIGAEDQRLLVRQSQTMLQLLSAITLGQFQPHNPPQRNVVTTEPPQMSSTSFLRTHRHVP